MVNPGTYVSRDSWNTRVGDHTVGAEQDDYTPFLDAGINEVGAISKIHAACIVGQPLFDNAMGTLVGVAMLAPMGITNTLFRMAGMPDLLHLELLPGLLLLALLGNLRPMGIMSMPIRW